MIVKALRERIVRWLRPLARSTPAPRASRPRLPDVLPSELGATINEALASDAVVDRAVELLGWEHPTRWKTWDFMKTAAFVSRHVSKRSSRILDAGCVGSHLLEYLYAEGYRELYGCDLSSVGVPEVPGLAFWQGDLTRTPWPAGAFDAIVCLSVLEHGVVLEAFVAEMARLLTGGGHLILTTDYREPKVDTSDVPAEVSFGLPWTVFSRAEVERFLELAAAHGLGAVGPVHWEVATPPVQCWGKTYSFLFLALQKA